jgi:hypothetical protein
MHVECTRLYWRCRTDLWPFTGLAITPDPDRDAKLGAASVLEYASKEVHGRNSAGLADILYISLVVACWLLAGYGQRIMPGGYSWDFSWEFANFLMTVAAISSFVLFVAGLFGAFYTGWKRVAIISLIGMVMAGILPIVMSLVAKRWLQSNFA